MDVKSLLTGLVADYCKISFGGLIWGFWGGFFWRRGSFLRSSAPLPATDSREEEEMATARLQDCLDGGSWLELNQ